MRTLLVALALVCNVGCSIIEEDIQQEPQFVYCFVKCVDRDICFIDCQSHLDNDDEAWYY